MARKINQAGLEELKLSEALRTKAYLDSGGVPTIGWGHTKGVKMGQVITVPQAEAFLREDLAWAERAVETSVTVPLNDNQFAALVSLCFNIGEGAFKKSTLVKKLNTGDYKSVPKELMKWVNDNGKRVQGLANRRTREGALFVKGSVSAPSSSNPTTANTGKTLSKIGKNTAGASVIVGTTVEQLSPYTDATPIIRYVVVALILLGLALAAYGLAKSE